MLLLFCRGGGGAKKEEPYTLFAHQWNASRKRLLQVKEDEQRDQQERERLEVKRKAEHEAQEWADRQAQEARDATRFREPTPEELAGFTALAQALVAAQVQKAEMARLELVEKLARIEEQRIAYEHNLIAIWLAEQDEEAAIMLLFS